jgi:hypothetical protein
MADATVRAASLTEQEIAAIREFRANPVGQHSPFLQRIINVMRSEPVVGKYVLLCTKPHQEWVLAQMNGRKKPLTIHGNAVFHDVVEGEYEIFRRRWERHFGSRIPDELLPGVETRR